MSKIYLDYAAATPVEAEVLESMIPFHSERFENPNSIHSGAVAVRRYVEEARRSVSSNIAARAGEVVFVGGGSESDNLAIFGTVAAFRSRHPGKGVHIITTAVEHSAVLMPIRKLEEGGVDVTYVPIGPDGIVDPSLIRDALTEETILVSVMYANNEIGTIQPISEIAKVIRRYKKEAGDPRVRYPLLHTDACQAPNYLEMNVQKLGVDLMSFSAAKMYGPKGSGVLYVKSGTPIEPVILGGSQEHGLRAGTENVPAIIGLAKAFTLATEMREKEVERLSDLRDHFIHELKRHIPNVLINGHERERLPNNVHMSIPGVDHQYLLIVLDTKGISCSTQSACKSAKADESHVLRALYDARDLKESPDGGIRFSMGRGTTKEGIDVVVQEVLEFIKHNT